MRWIPNGFLPLDKHNSVRSRKINIVYATSSCSSIDDTLDLYFYNMKQEDYINKITLSFANRSIVGFLFKQQNYPNSS